MWDSRPRLSRGCLWRPPQSRGRLCHTDHLTTGGCRAAPVANVAFAAAWNIVWSALHGRCKFALTVETRWIYLSPPAAVGIFDRPTFWHLRQCLSCGRAIGRDSIPVECSRIGETSAGGLNFTHNETSSTASGSPEPSARSGIVRCILPTRGARNRKRSVELSPGRSLSGGAPTASHAH